MRTIWTGFEPFGRHDENPSWAAARGAAGAVDGNPERADRLPVTFDAALEWVESELVESPPFLAVEFGLAANREAVCLERVGRRSVGDRTDEAGEVVEADRLGGEEEARLETSVELDSVAESAASELESLPVSGVRVSEDAGTFVCNALYYRSLIAAGDGSTALFVHIPKVENLAARDIGAAVGRAAAREVGLEEPSRR